MGSFIDIEVNRKRLQAALNEKLQLNPPLAIDGALGPRSLFAMKQFQQRVHLLPTDYFDPRILPFLGLAQEPNMPVSGVPAQLGDYVLNILESKVAWAAAAMVAVVVGWISTKFGISVPPDVQQLVTGLLVSAFGALIVILRGFFSNPKVVDGKVVK